MKTVIIFHGTGSSPNRNWFPWLKKQLESQGYRVIIPQFPHPKRQFVTALIKRFIPQLPSSSFEDWMKTLEEYKQYINKDTVLIGHSLGGLFLLRLLERLDDPINSAIFVSTSIGIKPITFYNNDYSFSRGFHFDWHKIRQNAGSFVVFHSDNDNTVSFKNGEQLAKDLRVKLDIIPNKGHLNSKSGYTKCLEILEKIEKLR